MPIAPQEPGQTSSQLIARASICQLERRVEASGGDPSSIWRTPGAWDDFGPLLDEWIEDASFALAYAAVAAMSVLDVAADSTGVLEIRLSRGALDLEWKPTDARR